MFFCVFFSFFLRISIRFLVNILNSTIYGTIFFYLFYVNKFNNSPEKRIEMFDQEIFSLFTVCVCMSVKCFV